MSVRPAGLEHMTQNTATVFAAIALLLCSCHAFEPAPSRRRPNVVLMMADDLASNDLSCCGGRNVRMPQLVFAPAEGPIIEPHVDEPTFVWCAGLGGTGVQTSPGLGQRVAGLVTGQA
jgi:hypothetical protein